MYVDSFTITINKRKSLVRVETIYYVSFIILFIVLKEWGNSPDVNLF